MTRKSLLRLVLPLLGLAAVPAALAAADTAAEPPAGQLLIASATIQDPRFYHSVILLLHHDKKGAFGILINRPLGTQPIAALLRGDGNRKPHRDGKPDHDAGIKGDIRVFFGGPVQPQLGFVIHTADYRRAATMPVGGGLAMTATRDVLRDIGRRKGPRKYLFALGYAGWGAGQLEAEMVRHDWFTAPADPVFVFDVDRAALWRKALANRTREL